MTNHECPMTNHERRTKGPRDQGTKGLKAQGTNGLRDQRPGPLVRRSFSPLVFWSLGLLVFAALTTFAAEPVKCAVSSPQWLRQGTIYEIFPRDFSPEGNFNGITARLDDLKDLGVNILWLMPINPPGEKLRKGTLGSPYAVRDYYAINPDYGTEADLKRLISEAHQRGLKVIIDIVANHTAWDSVLMQHPEFYKHDASGKIMPPNKDWTDVAGLNYANPELRQVHDYHAQALD